MAETDGVTVLVLRDAEGNVYFLDDKAINACRATPEQQAALTKAWESQDVAGFAGIPGLPGGLNIVVAPQINTAVGLNVVAGAGLSNITQGLGQGQGNQLFAFQK
jgi:hypothetical protein